MENENTINEQLEEMAEGVELADDVLDAVAGGWLFKNEKGEWEVINVKGDVRYTGDYNDAYDWAREHHYSTRVLSWLELNSIRNGHYLG